MFATRSAKAPAKDAPLTKLKKAIAAIAVLASGGIGGNFLGDYVQNRSWEYQHSIENVTNDTKAVQDALRLLNEQLDERWVATDRLYRAIQIHLSGDNKTDVKIDGATWEELVVHFYDVDAKWNLARNELLAALQLDVDAPFGVDGMDPSNAVAKLNCKTDGLADAENINGIPTARLLFLLSDHCMFDLKNDLDKTIAAKEETGLWKAFDPDHARLKYVFEVNNVLRCLVAERALAIRRDFSPTPLVWAMFWGGSSKPSPYSFASHRSRECGIPAKNGKTPTVLSLLQ